MKQLIIFLLLSLSTIVLGQEEFMETYSKIASYDLEKSSWNTPVPVEVNTKFIVLFNTGKEGDEVKLIFPDNTIVRFFPISEPKWEITKNGDRYQKTKYLLEGREVTLLYMDNGDLIIVDYKSRDKISIWLTN